MQKEKRWGLLGLVSLIVFTLIINSSFAESYTGENNDIYYFPRLTISSGSYGMYFIDLRLIENKSIIINGVVYFRDRGNNDTTIIGDGGGEIGVRLHNKEIFAGIYSLFGMNVGYSDISSGVGALMGPTQVERSIFISPSVGLFKKIGTFYISGIAELFIYRNNIFNILRFGIGI